MLRGIADVTMRRANGVVNFPVDPTLQMTEDGSWPVTYPGAFIVTVGTGTVDTSELIQRWPGYSNELKRSVQ